MGSLFRTSIRISRLGAARVGDEEEPEAARDA
jgi:hypothetical protein